MTARDWKPGDFQLFVDDKARRHTWRTPAEAVYGPPVNSGYEYRRLMVIDPEDREQVERLAASYERDSEPGTVAIDQMQAALREFTNPKPPKPDEPLGLGAVVEDADGARWVRFADNQPGGRNWASGEGECNRNWSEIDAARIPWGGTLS